MKTTLFFAIEFSHKTHNELLSLFGTDILEHELDFDFSPEKNAAFKIRDYLFASDNFSDDFYYEQNDLLYTVDNIYYNIKSDGTMVKELWLSVETY